MRLAFVTALQHLPARQRAALILCEVLKLPATEAASVLDSSVASVNSALQRARTALAGLPEHQRPCEVEPENAELLAKYVDAFQRYDIKALLGLLREDALQTMPPFEMWIEAAIAITKWMVPAGAEHVRRVHPRARAGERRARLGAGQAGPRAGGFVPWGLQVHEAAGGKFSRRTFFLDMERMFPLFGLRDRIFDDR